MAIQDCLPYVEMLELFEGFTPHERNMFASLAELVRLGPGRRLCSEGEPAAGLYVIAVGRLRFEKRMSGGGRETLYRIGAGRVVGHAGLVDGLPQSCDIVADEPSVVLVYPRKQFLKQFQAGSRYSIQLQDLSISQLSEQLRDANVALSGLADNAGESEQALRSLLDQIIDSVVDVEKAAGPQ